MSVPSAPLGHRVARRLALSGVAGAGTAWRLALSRRPLPMSGSVRTSRRLVVALDPADWLSVEIYRGFHERDEIRLLRHLVGAGGVAVDVGAHLGYYTATLSALVGPRGRVLAVEPAPPRLERLRQVVDALPLDNVTIAAVALGASSESRVLKQVESAHSGLATLRSGVGEGPGDVEVAVLPLVDVPEFLALGPRLDLLKVDVEGFEPEVLAGADPLFEEQRVRHALVEVSPNFGSVDWAAQFLDRHRTRYSAFAVTRRGRLRSRPRLVPLSPAGVLDQTAQFNMLMSRNDSVVTRLVDGGARRGPHQASV